MTVPLREALCELLTDWRADLSADWSQVLAGVEPALVAVDERLALHPWEPIFPSRRGFVLSDEPAGAHIFRAFDDLAPEAVRCVIIGQDPYPAIGFATGRAFEIGGYHCWSGLDNMWSHSVRSLIQSVYACRSGDPGYAVNINGWPRVLQAIRAPHSGFPPPQRLAQSWVEQGVLLLNSSFTLSRFSVAGDPHQLRGHLPLWRPLLTRLAQYFFERNAVFLLFGEVAADLICTSGIVARDEIERHPALVAVPHPAAADDYLKYPNPFVAGNEKLLNAGRPPVNW
ncbi:MAG: uracil-DNA glycosylase [Gammaproteobacteria bacterium]|nr:uracil-DNA glycosylase [Gammaproteobacteria bacterium]